MMERIKALYHFVTALLAVFYYGYPAKKLTVIAVTGTSGKTTTSHLIYSLFRNSGKKVSLISTVEAIINKKKFDTGFHVTTPNPFALQKFLKMAKEAGDQYVVIEASSHGIAQHRMIGTNVKVAVLTNIAHEHLDFHKTFHAYADSKLSLIKSSKIAIVNKDDSSYDLLKNCFPVKAKILTYSLYSEADFTNKNIPVKGGLPGDFNKQNMLAAGAVADIFNINEKVIKKTFLGFEGVKGRFEEIKNNRGYKIIIDFAHKPNALEGLLNALNKIKHNKIIVVFGCAGERDTGKREMMGEIAGKLADFSVLTAEDPRSEDVNQIIEEIARGFIRSGAKEGDFKKNCNYFIRISDRFKAIDYVINKAGQKGDILAFLGKSHEKSMCFGKIEYPWDEQDAILKALAKS